MNFLESKHFKNFAPGAIFFIAILSIVSFGLNIQNSSASSSSEKNIISNSVLTNNSAVEAPVESISVEKITEELQESAPEINLIPSNPVRVIIPAIDLDSRVLPLGKDKLGNMDVPSGKSNDVGWYKYGTLPGNVGSAVLDAHVFAAFSNLHKLKAGDDIYVINNQNQKLRFVVEDAQTYKLSNLSPNTLFHQKDAARLNLITCAGSLTADGSTYTHRLIVFTKYAGVEAA